MCAKLGLIATTMPPKASICLRSPRRGDYNVQDGISVYPVHPPDQPGFRPSRLAQYTASRSRCIAPRGQL